jgi:hypothetical protein
MQEAIKAVTKLCNSIEVVVGGDEGGTALATMLPWLQPSVERCVFAHVGNTVWDLYGSRFAVDDRAYLHKVQPIARATPEQLFRQLGVHEDFSSPTKSAGSVDCQPFARASYALSRLGSSLRSACHPSPSEVAQAISAALLELRRGALAATRGASELVAMDDLLPLFVFVLSRSELRCPFALAAYAEDALSPEARLGVDCWAMRLLESSARFLTYEFEPNELESNDCHTVVDECCCNNTEGVFTMTTSDESQTDDGLKVCEWFSSTSSEANGKLC